MTPIELYRKGFKALVDALDMSMLSGLFTNLTTAVEITLKSVINGSTH